LRRVSEKTSYITKSSQHDDGLRGVEREKPRSLKEKKSRRILGRRTRQEKKKKKEKKKKGQAAVEKGNGKGGRGRLRG